MVTILCECLGRWCGCRIGVARSRWGGCTAPLLIVPDVQAALEDLGRAARARTKAKVIAVTGSVGKTSTKEMLRHMLGAAGKPMLRSPVTTITGAFPYTCADASGHGIRRD